MSEMTPEKATALRRPFPPESIGRLPKGGQMLDFVGHAAVVDRLLAVDPEWSWEPFALGPDGLPAIDRHGNLWIRLTICGVTRIGVGDGKSLKECIGDALRNGAMRFGVALDLWAKENLVEFAQAAATAQRQGAASPAPPTAGSIAARTTPKVPASAGVKSDPDKARARMFALFGELKIADADQLPGINHILGTTHTSRKDLSDDEVRAVIKRLDEKKRSQEGASA
jgi:hypothetical protein